MTRAEFPRETNAESAKSRVPAARVARKASGWRLASPK